ncbi:MAG TPA: DMT family transporter [Ktedonobacterales bacterium]|nr:DMT family transporter [Ktedonobacterales bacterium]
MRAREYGVLFALALIWGASFFFIKVAVAEISPATTVTLRLAFSVLTLLLIVAVRPELMAGWRRYWKLGLVVGIINNLIPFVLVSWGETVIASGVASILNATTPLFTVLIANWLPGTSRETLTPRRGGGVLLGFIGVGVLVGPAALNLGGGGIAHTLGELAVLVAAAAYGVGAILSRRFGGAATLVAPLSCQLTALVLILPVALVWSPPTKLPSPGAIGAVAVLGILGTALAYLLYFWLIHHVGATRTSLVTYLLPCTALVWGALLLHEHISWNALAGLLLVLLGTMLTNGAFNGKMRRKALPAGMAASTGRY